jgi:hypothetical protein
MQESLIKMIEHKNVLKIATYVIQGANEEGAGLDEEHKNPVDHIQMQNLENVPKSDMSEKVGADE